MKNARTEHAVTRVANLRLSLVILPWVFIMPRAATG